MAGEPPAPSSSLRIAGQSYPVVLPSWKDPRLHLGATFVVLYVLGFTQFHFKLSIPQILFSILTCALIELVVTFRQKRMIIWPASALLTGNGIAFILRIPGTRHGDWWTFHGAWIYVATGAVAMASKYLIHFRGRHIFNPSNIALVLAFVILGSSRVEPLQFWWGPLSPALVIVLLVIVGAAMLILTRVGLLAVSVIFWLTFASRARHPGVERPCVHRELAPRSGRGLVLLEGARLLAGGVHLPRVHDHRPEDGAGDEAGTADLLRIDRPVRSAADRPDADRVLGEGRAARLADDRVRRPARHHPHS